MLCEQKMGDLVQQAVLNAEEEIEIAAQRHRPPRFHTRDDPFQLLSDAAFLKMYRMTKELAQNIIDLVDPYIVPQTRCSALDTSVKVLTALRFFASGSYQLDIGKNVNSAVSQASTSQCINEVVEALNQPQIFDEWVKFPQNFRELNNIRNEFYQRYQFPGVIGCVDCTHVAIVPPKSNDAVYPEHIYVNRKNYHSINVQLVSMIKNKVTLTISLIYRYVTLTCGF
ncbi:putative nuclease HARBI1 [Zophobas morio]|uniref:putative nuclease HARBI1 n=1 Tax=Zophobas morio TaxID=2755281 RepID=UPI0030834C88